MNCILFTIAGEKNKYDNLFKTKFYLQIHFVSDECEIGPCGQISLNIFLGIQSFVVCSKKKKKQSFVVVVVVMV